VERWRTTAFRLFWRWKSRERSGRPPINKAMQDLIRKLRRENPLWGAERIRDTLLLLSYDPPRDDTIRKYMVRPRRPCRKSATRLLFLQNHLDVSWAMDFLTVTTFRIATLYVFVVLDYGRLRAIHLATTYTPSMKWVIQQLREATPFGGQPRYLFRDNDGIHGHGV
jgi:putative transposase